MSGFNESPTNPTGYTPGVTAGNPNDPFAGSAPTSSAAADPYAAAYTAPAYGTPGYVPPGYPAPPAPGLPNPGLATVLGFIPGVGAMYNGQFAKGLAHVVIFAVLISLSDHVNGIFGLLVAGWYFYMVFDAYQTARARRDGLVAPDPFGLNNIGDKFGIGTGPNWSDFTARPAPGSTSPQSPYTPPAAGYAEYRDSNMHASVAPDGTATYRDANATYVTGPGGSAFQDTTGTYAATGTPFANAAAQAQPAYGTPGTVPPYVPQSPYPGQPAAYGSAYASPLPPLNSTGTGLPTGAIWLIGFGVFSLIGTLSHRFYWSNRFLDGAAVAAVGVVLLVTRTLRARGVYPAGSAASRWYLLRSSRVGLALLAVGIALTIDHAGALTWHYLWPYLLILLGAFLLVERAAHNRMLAAGPVDPMAQASDPSGYDAAAPEPNRASFIPRDEEGR